MNTEVRQAALNLAASTVGAMGNADIVLDAARKFEAYLSGGDKTLKVPRIPSLAEAGSLKGVGRKSSEKCLLDRIDAVIALGHEPSYSMKRAALEWLAQYEPKPKVAD